MNTSYVKGISVITKRLLIFKKNKLKIVINLVTVFDLLTKDEFKIRHFLFVFQIYLLVHAYKILE